MPAVGGHQPVALPVGGGRHAHDGLVEVDVAGGAEEAGVTEAEDPPVGGHHPVALAVGSGRHAHDGLVEMDVAGRAEIPGVAEGEDAAVGGHHPVALAGRGGGLLLAGRIGMCTCPGGLDGRPGGDACGPGPGRHGSGDRVGPGGGARRNDRRNHHARAESQKAEDADRGDPRPPGATRAHPVATADQGHPSVRPGRRCRRGGPLVQVLRPHRRLLSMCAAHDLLVPSGRSLEQSRRRHPRLDGNRHPELSVAGMLPQGGLNRLHWGPPCSGPGRRCAGRLAAHPPRFRVTRTA